MPREPRLPKPPTTPGLLPGTRAAIRDMPDGQLQCGIYHFHAFVHTGEYRPYNPGERRGVRNITPLIMNEQECARCGKIRTDVFNARTMEKIKSTYDTPDNWVEPGIPRGVKPGVVFQQEAYRRAMEKVANAKPGQRATADA